MADRSQGPPTADTKLRLVPLAEEEEFRPLMPASGDGPYPDRLDTPLGVRDVANRLAQLRGWEITDDGDSLTRTYFFPSLRAAVAFIAMVAEIGERDGYVPEIDLRLLEVTVRIDTHVGEPLTALDFEVARSLELR